MRSYAAIAILAAFTAAGHADQLPDLLVDHGARLDAGSVTGWTAQPGWLGNASGTATVTAEGALTCFAVPEPRRGMKWSHAMGGVWLQEAPWLVVRYRAQQYEPTGGYFVYLDDGAHKGEVYALKPEDVKADGQWHTVAVDAQAAAHGESIEAVAVQVQTDAAGDGRLWLDSLTFMAAPPEGAEVIGGGATTAAADYSFPVAQSLWVAQPSWLAVPTEKQRTVVEGERATFAVSEAGRGMKWLWKLPESAPLEGRGYLVVRYRASNVSAQGDYAISVLGNLLDGGMNYTTAAMPTEWACDGRWHTASIGIRQVTEKFTAAEALAVQVIADAQLPAKLELESLTLASRPAESPLSDWVEARPAKAHPGFAPVELPAERNLALADMLAALQMSGTFDAKEIAVAGVPFRLAPSPELLSTSLDGTGELRVPLQGKAAEVYVLTLNLFCGGEEPVRGSGKLTAIRDVDRFRLAVTYADGLTDEFLPLDVLTGRHEVRRGPAVVCVPVDPKRALRELTLTDATERGAFALAAVTFGRRGTSTPFAASRGLGAASVAQSDGARSGGAGELRLSEKGEVVRLTSAGSAVALRLSPTPSIVELTHGATGATYRLSGDAATLFQVTVGGETVPADGLTPLSKARLQDAAVHTAYRVGDTGVQLGLTVESTPTGELRLRTSLKNATQEAKQVALVGPQVAGYVLGNDLTDNWYFALSQSLHFSNQPARLCARHCGHGSPVQFVTTFNPQSGDGLYLRTEDTLGDCRNYVTEKSEAGMAVGVECPVRALAPGETVALAPTVFGLCGGDWRPAFHAYRDWLKTRYRPASPRKQWFRNVFNFRQRFLYAWDPLFDSATRKLELVSAVQEGERSFGGADYVHLFDWGSVPQYGRVYGREGDYSPFDLMSWKKEDLRAQVAELQQAGVPVGLYIEGYLLQENGKLGSGRGKAWQIKNAKGEPLYWPESTEMFVCPWVKDWQAVQAHTYANMIRDLGVNGMYLDEFGFADAGKDCYDPAHGHPVPGYCVSGERDCTRRVRGAMDTVNPETALYGEETPPDVNSQYQDGSFTYVMRHSLLQSASIPLNLFRFAVPSFKSFQILVCDKPTGTWATGVKWTFFNGDGIWLEGVAGDWFASQTRAAIRKCHALLREHRDAFTSDTPEPLVPTEQSGVYANLFPTPTKRVYTLYNSQPQTVRGNLLRVPRQPGARYLDAWNGKSLTPMPDGADDLLPLELGPMDVGCIVCTSVQ